MEPFDILVVDDDPDDLALFQLAIKRSGLNIRLNILTAGQQAIDYLEAKGLYSDRALHPLPDLIVLDLKMPTVSGLDFLAWRKPSRAMSSIPVAVCSGSKDPTEISRAIEMGADKLIVKPADLKGWKEAIDEIWNFGNYRAATFERDPN